ncbi:MAG TPA: hypothetical protein VFK38_09095 [Candidatus Limnocylindrales bacterium]|nr:hypothetical protein [Candidatus Limnocylindrales bacterium]
MIVVLGRPWLALDGVEPRPAGLAARIALAAHAAGGRVELVGSVGDDENGDRLALALGRAGIGHAALLRIPGATTPTGPADAQPRLDPRDVDLGLRYVPDCRVLVLAEAPAPEVESVALEAGRYHGAHVVAVVPAGAEPRDALVSATVLEAPGPEGEGAFAELVGRYAAGLAEGRDAATAFADARSTVGWARQA